MKYSKAALEAKFTDLPTVSEVQEAFKAVHERFDKLEEWAGAIGSVFARGFLGRAKWFFTGK